MTSRSTLPLTPLASIPFTPAEFEGVWLVFLAAGAGRLFTEDEKDKNFGKAPRVGPRNSDAALVQDDGERRRRRMTSTGESQRRTKE